MSFYIFVDAWLYFEYVSNIHRFSVG